MSTEGADKVGMSLDEIIKMNKKPGSKRGRGRGRGRMRGRDRASSSRGRGGRGGRGPSARGSRGRGRSFRGRGRGRGGSGQIETSESPTRSPSAGTQGTRGRGRGGRRGRGRGRGRGAGRGGAQNKTSAAQIVAKKRVAAATRRRIGRGSKTVQAQASRGRIKDARQKIIAAQRGLQTSGLGETTSGMRSDAILRGQRGRGRSRGRGRLMTVNINNTKPQVDVQVNPRNWRGRGGRGRGMRGRGASPRGGVQDRTRGRSRGRRGGRLSRGSISRIKQQVMELSSRGSRSENFSYKRSDFGRAHTGTSLNDRFSDGSQPRGRGGRFVLL